MSRLIRVGMVTDRNHCSEIALACVHQTYPECTVIQVNRSYFCVNLYETNDRLRTLDVILLDLDTYYETPDFIMVVSRFRVEHRDVPIVVMSQRVRSHDFSRTRRSICDATLRIPFDSEDGRRALYAAIANNLKAANLSEALQYLGFESKRKV